MRSVANQTAALLPYPADMVTHTNGQVGIGPLEDPRDMSMKPARHSAPSVMAKDGLFRPVMCALLAICQVEQTLTYCFIVTFRIVS